MKVRLEHDVDEKKYYVFRCPACGFLHQITVPPWTFNGDFEKPTIQASVLVKSLDRKGVPTSICHSFVTDGKIKFLGDCTHDMKNQEVPLEDL